jgi:hypothetical protein
MAGMKKQWDVSRIKSDAVRQRLEQAVEYKNAIDDFVDQQSGEFKETLQEAAAQVNGWIDLMLELAEAIDLYENNPILKDTLGKLPLELESLKLGIDKERDSRRKSAMQRDLDARQQQLDKLQVIEQGVLQANHRIEAILAQLQKVYALTQVPPDVEQ